MYNSVCWNFQWLGICLSMQGTQVQSLVEEESHAMGQLRPCATTIIVKKNKTKTGLALVAHIFKYKQCNCRIKTQIMSVNINKPNIQED